MPSTTVHIPDDILEKIDQVILDRKISRNKFIVLACEEALKKSAGDWPRDFFSTDLNDQDQLLLREGIAEMEEFIQTNRKNRIGSNV